MEERDQHIHLNPCTCCHSMQEERLLSPLRHWRNTLAGLDLPYFNQKKQKTPAVTL